MSDKKVYDIEVRKELKDTKQVMDKAISDLTNVVISKEQLIKENGELKQKIKHLEQLLINSKEIPSLSLNSHEEEIIKVELKRMYDVHVLQNIPLVDKDDIKKLKILVEALSIIKNGKKPVKKKEKEMSLEDAFELMTSESKEQ